MTPVQGVCQLASDQGKAGGGGGSERHPEGHPQPPLPACSPCSEGVDGGWYPKVLLVRPRRAAGRGRGAGKPGEEEKGEGGRKREGREKRKVEEDLWLRGEGK